MFDNLLEKFTSHFKRILIQAQNIAWQEHSSAIEPVHILEALLQQRGCIGIEIMQKQNVTINTVVFRSPERLNVNMRHSHPSDFWNMPQPSQKSQRIIELAVKTSYEYRHKYVGSEHLLMGIVKTPDSKLRAIFTDHRVNVSTLMEQIHTILKSTSRFNNVPSESANDGSDTDMLTESGAPASVLEAFTTNLTTDKVQKNIDPVIGRASEINRLIQILSRRTKNNPILVGDPGVGKTAIIEGLAKKITEGAVPDILMDKRILTLDLSAVVAGTMYRGEFENRLKQIIDEVKQDESIILFIDEIHNIIGTGSSAGSLDAANILKPALARGQLRCIGATTHEEYKKFIESDKALERRFQVIMIDEATEAETMEILKGIKSNYENYHNVTITDDALQAAITLSQRYQPDKKMPDKAIDLIDEAASQLKISKKYSSETKRIRELEHNIKAIQETKRSFIMNENYTQALNIKDQEDIILQELHDLKSLKNKASLKSLGIIAAIDIAHVIAQATNIPLSEIVASDKKQLTNLEQLLNKHLYGQAEAISRVAETIRRSRSGLADPRKPLGSFMFLGPSGVGKTEMARLLSRFLFNREDALIRIDMSEFAERFNVSKLLGAPAGYVGYKEGNIFTDAVRKKPYSVVLFDEIEKAHPDVFNILLPVLEDGYLTDATGKRVNFKNTIIIMTSNIGLKEFTTQAQVGFSLEEGEQGTIDSQQLTDYINTSLKEQFRPEFLNRLDGIVIFNPLTLAIAKKIVQRELEEVKQRLSARNHVLHFEPSVLTELVSGFKPAEGARSLKRAIQERVINPLSRALLSGSAIATKEKITAKIENNEIVFE
ncbi:MAG: ATP-dependent Clp protease ATP-binding subunit [Candidatus Komeilibacteria bacterium]|nr:ATP-dependent Clp protease ATP-binding subunit [Candidatus Komeilibacteria bacterium]